VDPRPHLVPRLALGNPGRVAEKRLGGLAAGFQVSRHFDQAEPVGLEVDTVLVSALVGALCIAFSGVFYLYAQVSPSTGACVSGGIPPNQVRWSRGGSLAAGD